MKRTQATPTTGSPARRLRALAIALALLALAFPAIPAAIGAVALALLGIAAHHTTAVLATAGVVYLLRAAPSLSRRAITALAGPSTARLVLGTAR